MKKWLVLGFLIIAIGGYAAAKADGFYYGLNLSEYQPHTDIGVPASIASVQHNENAERSIALVGGYAFNKYVNIEASYRRLNNFNYRVVRNSPASEVLTGAYDVTLITIGDVIKFDNGFLLQAGLYQHTADGSVSSSTTAPVFGISSGDKQSSQWGIYYGGGFELIDKKGFSLRADLQIFPVIGDQSVLGAEGKAVMFGISAFLR